MEKSLRKMLKGACVFIVSPLSPLASATGTQTDLALVGGAKGAGAGRVPVRVEFRESGLTYMDRLLLKKHRR